MGYKYHRSFDKGFPLSNCVLYALGWYYKTGDVWADLRNCIEADGYLGSIMSKWDMVRLILNIADDWNLYAANKGYNLISVSRCLIPENELLGWKIFDNENPELVGIAYRMLNAFALDYTRQELPLKKPHFSKKSPLKPQRYKEGQTYASANRLVEHYKWAE